MENRVFMITTTLSEVLSVRLDTIIISPFSRYNYNMHDAVTGHEDGVVTLLYVMIPPSHTTYSM